MDESCKPPDHADLDTVAPGAKTTFWTDLHNVYLDPSLKVGQIVDDKLFCEPGGTPFDLSIVCSSWVTVEKLWDWYMMA